MIVEIDSDNLITELDENNNVKVFDYTSAGLSSRSNLIFGSIGVLVLVIIVGLILKRGGHSELKSMDLDASGNLVQQQEQSQPTKPAGPPKSLKPNQNSARPKGTISGVGKSNKPAANLLTSTGEEGSSSERL